MPKYIYEYQWVDDDPAKWRMGSMSFAANGQWWHSRGTVLYNSPEEAHIACATAIDVTHSFGRCGPCESLQGGEAQRGAANWRIRITGVDATSHLKKRHKESLIK